MTTWMIVEDEPGLYEVFQGLCEVIGIEPLVFTDGDMALEWVESVESGAFAGELPELMILDDRLPSALSGPLLGARIRQSPPLKHLPIVLTTAAVLTQQQVQAYLDMAQTPYLLRKPWPRIQALEQSFRAIAQSSIGESENQIIF